MVVFVEKIAEQCFAVTLTVLESNSLWKTKLCYGNRHAHCALLLQYISLYINIFPCTSVMAATDECSTTEKTAEAFLIITISHWRPIIPWCVCY